MRVLLPDLQEIRGFSAHQLGFYREFHRGVAHALQELGHEAIRFPFARQSERAPGEAEALGRILSSGVAGVLDLCCWGYGLSHFVLHTRDGRQRPIYDLYEVPYVGLLLDHPHNQAINGIVARRLYAACPDRGHPEQLRLAYPELALQGAVFSPPAVQPDNNRSVASWSDRDIDVLYVGTLTPPMAERFWRDPANGYWHASYDGAMCDAIADAALAAPERSFHLAVQEAVAGTTARPPGFALKPQMRAVEAYLRSRFRLDAVRALARSGRRMHVVGGGWEACGLPASVTQLAGVDYQELFGLAGRARICLDASTYLDGANDRVFSYALSGAVCFTNAAGFLRGEFDGAMRFYSMLQLDGLVDGVQELLGQPAALRAAGDLARERVRASHTWRSRLEGIVSLFRL